MQSLNLKYLQKLRDAFEAEKPARTVEFTEDELKVAKRTSSS